MSAKKILDDKKKYASDLSTNKSSHIDIGGGDEIESVFNTKQNSEEIERLLLFLNKDKIAQA